MAKKYAGEKALGVLADEIKSRSLVGHDHDDIYYTVEEMNPLLNEKADKGDSYTKSESDAKHKTLEDSIKTKAPATHDHAISEIANLQETIDAFPKALKNPYALSFVNNSGVVVDDYIGSEQVLLKAGSNTQIASGGTNSNGIPIVEISATDTTYSGAGASLGLVKTGGDVTISGGVITVNDDSHNHVVGNIDGLQSTLDGKVPNTRTINGKQLSSNITLSFGDVGAEESGTASSLLNTHDSNGDAHPAIRSLISSVSSKLDAFLEGEAISGTAIDTLKEIQTYIDSDEDKAAEMLASINANATNISGHTGNNDIHVTTTNKNNWNDAYNKRHSHSNKTVIDGITAALVSNWTTAFDHSKVAHAPSDAEANQNAFSNIIAGSTTVSADSKTDSLIVIGGSNVTVTGDADNDSITIDAVDTLNTAGSSNTSEKIFLVGTLGQRDSAQTYSHDTVYVDTDGHLYSNSVQVVNLSGSQALTNKTYNGFTLAAACEKGVTDSTAAGAIGTGTNLVTERDVYYGLPKINNGHSYNSGSSFYAPTTGGDSGYVLKGNGATSAPTWVNPNTLTAGSVKTNLVVKLNSGTTEGTNQFTFNGSETKAINITPSAIGAAPSSHDHSAANITSGVLAVAQGGTGKNAFDSNELVYGNSSNGLDSLGLPAKNNAVLRQSTTGTPFWDTTTPVVEVLSALPTAPVEGVLYIVPAEKNATDTSYIFASTAPTDTTKIWIDTANSNIPKVFTGSSWITLGSVYS